jgi:hypothetical protein
VPFVDDPWILRSNRFHLLWYAAVSVLVLAGDLWAAAIGLLIHSVLAMWDVWLYAGRIPAGLWRGNLFHHLFRIGLVAYLWRSSEEIEAAVPIWPAVALFLIQAMFAYAKCSTRRWLELSRVARARYERTMNAAACASVVARLCVMGCIGLAPARSREDAWPRSRRWTSDCCFISRTASR